jgi:hypothetical protein
MDLPVLNLIEHQEDPAKWVSEKGIVLRLRKVASIILSDAGRKLKEPVVPKIFDEEKGREEENPNDPDYRSAYEDITYRRSMLAIDVYLAFGTEVVEIPDDLDPPESPLWIADLQEFGLEIPKGGKARYVAWLKYYALSDQDLTSLSIAAMRFGGATLEADAQAAQDGFQPDSEGETLGGGVSPQKV